MKKVSLFSVLTCASAAVILIASGCKKSSDNGAGANGINATVNGAAWQSLYTTGAEPGNDSFIYLVGFMVKSGDTTSVELDISDTTHLNQPDPLASSGLLYYKQDGTAYSGEDFFNGHGSITVTTWDKTAHKIAGIFNGVLYNTQNSNDSMKVENGHFNTTYLVQ